MDSGDIDLTLWGQTSDSSLHSDNSDAGSPMFLREFGDLAIADNDYDNDNVVEASAANSDNKDKLNDELLHRLSNRHDDFLSTMKSRYRFSYLTELDETEQYADPDIIRLTSTCSLWSYNFLADLWYKIQVFFARKCKLPCCKEYTWPQEWARHRRFSISKKSYLALPGLTSQENEAILRWSGLASSQEWYDGNWNERGILTMSDAFKFQTQKVSWSVMEDHLATLAYSDKKPLVILAARICIESLAKNKALYTYNHQYWGFARICTDLLKSPYEEVQEGLLMALQLYLRTLKIFHSCFSHKCMEYASSGLFPVLLSLLEMCPPCCQAMIINILILMSMYAPYINFISDLGGLNSLMKLTSTEHSLLARRVFACLEIMSRHAPVQSKLIQDGIFPIAVRHLSVSSSTPVQLSCIFILNILCSDWLTLVKTLAVENYLLVKTAMRILTDFVLSLSSSYKPRSQSLHTVYNDNWCSLSRQNLILICKLCVDETACRQMVKQGLVLKLKSIWNSCNTLTDQVLVMEALSVLSRFPRPADKLCQEGFLSILAENIRGKQYQELILNIVSNLGNAQLQKMLETGLMEELIHCFGDKVFERQSYPAIVSILASFGGNEKLQDLILNSEGKVYTLVLDTAFLTSDTSVLVSCITILRRLNTKVIQPHILKQNTVQLVVYIDKLLNTGPEHFILHGLVHLQDYLTVDFLYKAFLEHHICQALEMLCKLPYKPPVQIMAERVLESFTGMRSRRSSIRENKTGDNE